MRYARFAALIATTTLLAGAAAGQAPAAAKTALISIQPLSPMVGSYSAEFEKALAPTVTLGIGGSHSRFSDDVSTRRYNSVDAKLRYYPAAHPFRGFSLAGQAGYSAVSDEMDFGSAGSQTLKATGPAVGAGLDYSWLLGASQSFYLGVGVGAKKIFTASSDIGNARASYATGELSVGYAF